MANYILRRCLYLVAIILVVSTVTFTLMHSIPGGPFDREKRLPQQVIDNLNKRYHLDEPLINQFGRYLFDSFVPRLTTTAPDPAKFDDDFLIDLKLGPVWFRWMNFGPSYISNRTVNDIFREQLPVSTQLGIMSLCVAIAMGIPLGMLAALKQNTAYDYLAMSVAILGVSVPVIVMGPILIWIFGITLKWLPPTGWGSKPPYLLGIFPSSLTWDFVRRAIMPTFALGLGNSAIIARLTRASLLQVIREDYIRTARAKGLREQIVLFRHILRNSMLPVVTILGPMLATLITGTFVAEWIFGIPGMGKYFVNSITNRDYTVIMGTILLYAVFLVMANLIVDVLYAYLDPRIRYE